MCMKVYYKLILTFHTDGKTAATFKIKKKKRADVPFVVSKNKRKENEKLHGKHKKTKKITLHSISPTRDTRKK